MNTSVLAIDGMACSGCVNTVENALSALPGVKSVKVILENGTAEISFDEQEVQEAEFEKAVKDAGYQVKGIKA